MSQSRKQDYLTHDWFAAQLAAALCDFKPIVEEETDDEPGVTLADDTHLPVEVMVERRDALRHLSVEARTVAELLFEAPNELLEFFSPRGEPSKSQLQKYLHLIGWKPKAIRRAFKDLTRYVAEHLS